MLETILNFLTNGWVAVYLTGFLGTYLTTRNGVLESAAATSSRGSVHITLILVLLAAWWVIWLLVLTGLDKYVVDRDD